MTSFNYWNIIRNRTFWLIFASYLLISIGVYIVSDFIVTYGVVELTVPHLVASTFISIVGLTSIVGGSVLMTLSDYTRRVNPLLIIHSLLTLSILFIILPKVIFLL